MRAPFELFEPTGLESPVVVEVPHAGLELPAQFLASLTAPARALGRDADLYVDSLYEGATHEGASVLVCRVSRYIADVNRAEADVDADVVDGGRRDVVMRHGLVWRTTSDGEPALSRRLTRPELEERLELVWRPYHRALSALVDRKRERFGIAVVLAAHSMPSVDRAAGGGVGERVRDRFRADVVPGTRGRKSAAARFIDKVEELAVGQGWTVRHDDPYAGGFTTQHYGRPEGGVHVIQVELARRLYLNEATLRPTAEMDSVKVWCRRLVAELGALASSKGPP